MKEKRNERKQLAGQLGEVDEEKCLFGADGFNWITIFYYSSILLPTLSILFKKTLIP